MADAEQRKAHTTRREATGLIAFALALMALIACSGTTSGPSTDDGSGGVGSRSNGSGGASESTGGDDGPGVPGTCEPGRSTSCAGPGGCQGGQTCKSDGTAWGPCSCDPDEPTNACDPPCGEFQVCSDGMDGYVAGECWGCEEVSADEFQGNASSCDASGSFYNECPSTCPDGCIGFGNGSCCCG